MRIFKKSGLDQNKFFVTNTFHLDRHQKSYIRPDNLTHVMHLFEEKSKYAATPVTGPLPIKANGAIVVNRPTQNKNGTVRSLPIYLQDIPFQDEEEIKIPSSNNDTSNNIVTIKEEMHTADLVHEENKRLRQQVLLEREQYEKWRISKEKLEQELKFAHRTIKNMQRVIDRFQRLILLSEKSITDKNSRRQSTGVTFDYLNTSHVVESYEHKIQILLNEIDSMEIQEKEAFKQSIEQKKECENLTRRLKYKDDIIRQLVYDLQFERNSGQL